jgi:hypothetical protein
MCIIAKNPRFLWLATLQYSTVTNEKLRWPHTHRFMVMWPTEKYVGAAGLGYDGV